MGVISMKAAKRHVEWWNIRHPDMFVPWETAEEFVISCNTIWFAAKHEPEEVEKNNYWAGKLPCQLIEELV